MKGDRMAKRSSFGNIVRRRLSDITNSLPQSKSPAKVEKPTLDLSSREQIDNLSKENMALAKVIQDKNKVIELSGNELQRLRINLQKMQMQNWNLAQANSLMIAELNFSNQKLKSLQHEISCKEALLKAKTLEVVKEAEVIPEEEIEQDNDGKTNRCQRFTRSRSLGHSTISQQQVAAKDAAENKRRCLRRQSSSSSRIQHSESKENLFEIEDMALMPTDYPNRADGPPPPSSPVLMMVNKQQEEKDDGATESRTSMGGRPSRKAAEKVQSYKEIPLNTKMRRL